MGIILSLKTLKFIRDENKCGSNWTQQALTDLLGSRWSRDLPIYISTPLQPCSEIVTCLSWLAPTVGRMGTFRMTFQRVLYERYHCWITWSWVLPILSTEKTSRQVKRLRILRGSWGGTSYSTSTDSERRFSVNSTSRVFVAQFSLWVRCPMATMAHIVFSTGPGWPVRLKIRYSLDSVFRINQIIL